MIAGVADTHTALWYLFDDRRLSNAAGAFIDRAAAGRQKIAISSISLAEVVYLIEKNRLPVPAYDELMEALVDPDHVFTEAVLNAAIVRGDAVGVAFRKYPRCQTALLRQPRLISACRFLAAIAAFAPQL